MGIYWYYPRLPLGNMLELICYMFDLVAGNPRYVELIAGVLNFHNIRVRGVGARLISAPVRKVGWGLHRSGNSSGVGVGGGGLQKLGLLFLLKIKQKCPRH